MSLTGNGLALWGILYPVCLQLKPNDVLLYKFYFTAQKRSVKPELLMSNETAADAALS
jgi:hypothetical protein